VNLDGVERFCEPSRRSRWPAPHRGVDQRVVWFALNGDRPLFAFGGLWTEFKGDRGTKSKPIPSPYLVYGFLTTAPRLFNSACSRTAQG
jgi:putative SOS response-associated peptidase YedK